MNAFRWGSWLLLGLAALGAGCDGARGGKAYVTRIPTWEYASYQRVAVAAARPSDARAEAQTRRLADRLTTLLTQSGEFKVLSREEMQQAYAEQDLSRLVDAIDEGTALPEGRIQVAQALIVPKITDLKLIRDKEERVRPVYGRDPEGRLLRDRRGLPVKVGETKYVVFRHGAEVEATVRVLDPATSRILASHTARVAPDPEAREGGPPRETPEQMAEQAVEELAVDFFKFVAPTKIRVDLKGKMLLVATDYVDGRYEETNKVPVTLPEILVAVRELPESARRNDFRVAISPEEGRQNLWEQSFTWSGSTGVEGMQFRVPLAVLKESGASRFLAKLYVAGDPQPKIERKFGLVAPKE